MARGTRSNAQIKADRKYYQRNKDEIKAKNARRQQLRRDRERRTKLFEGLPPSSPPPESSPSPPPERSPPRRQSSSRRRSPPVRRADIPVRSSTHVFQESMARIENEDSGSESSEDKSDCKGEADTGLFTSKELDKLLDTHSDVLAGVQRLRQFTVDVENWVSCVGPLEEWPQLFQKGYDAACAKVGGSTQEEVDEYLGSVGEHVRNGKLIVQELRSSPITRPPASHDTWGDYLTAGDLLWKLCHGMAILEVRLDIFAPRGPLPTDCDSHTRRWSSLQDRF